VNGRRVQFAPFLTGAKPTIASQALGSPNRHRRIPPARLLRAELLAQVDKLRAQRKSRGASACGIGDSSAGLANGIPMT
jgi:hypothetical protein